MTGITAEGRKGSLHLKGGELVIQSRGTFGTQRPEQRIAVKTIRTVHFREAGLRLGFIYFDAGSLPTLATPSSEAANRKSGLQFSEKAQPEFAKIRDAVMAEITSSD